MEQTVIKVGNSAGIILPQAMRQEMQVKTGDKVVIEKKGDHYLLRAKKKTVIKEVDAKFAQMVHEFFDEHDDVLQELTHQ